MAEVKILAMKFEHFNCRLCDDTLIPPYDVRPIAEQHNSKIDDCISDSTKSTVSKITESLFRLFNLLFHPSSSRFCL